ncbi:MAG: hypothetical protein U0836_02155 [Pirellulales bacterium]
MSWQTSLIFIRGAASPADALSALGYQPDEAAAPLDFDTATSGHAGGASVAQSGEWLVIADPGFCHHLPIKSVAEQRASGTVWNGAAEARLKALSKSAAAACYYFALAGPVDAFGFAIYDKGRTRRRILAEPGERLRTLGKRLPGEPDLDGELTEGDVLELIDRSCVPFQALSALSFQPCAVAAKADREEPFRQMGAAIEQIRVGDNAQQAFATLERLLRDPDPLVRSITLRHVTELGAGARPLQPILVELLEDRGVGTYIGDERMRVSVGAACALLLIDPDDPVAQARVEHALTHERGGGSQRCVFETLQQLGPRAKQFAVPLRRLARKNIYALMVLKAIAPEVADELERQQAERAAPLGALMEAISGGAKSGPEFERQLAILIEGLQRPEAVWRVNAALALGNLGPRAAIALPQLLACLSDEAVERQAFKISVRVAAACAILRIVPEAVPEPAAAVARETLSAPSASGFGWIAQAVLRMGSGARMFLPDLEASMALASPAQQTALRQAITRIEG